MTCRKLVTLLQHIRSLTIGNLEDLLARDVLAGFQRGKLGHSARFEANKLALATSLHIVDVARSLCRVPRRHARKAHRFVSQRF